MNASLFSTLSHTRTGSHDPRSHVAGTHQNARSNDYVQRVMSRAGLHFEEVLTRQSRELLQTGIKGTHAVKALETGVFPSLSEAI